MTAAEQTAAAARAERLVRRAGLRCTYRACPNPPIRRMTRNDGNCHWWGCAQHYPAMLDALHIGLPGATNGTGWVEVVDLTIGNHEETNN